MTIIASLMYTSPSWWGYTLARDRDRMTRFVNRMKKRGYLPPDAPAVETMAEEAYTPLFRAVINNRTQVLRKHLPPARESKYGLRSRPHEYVPPVKDEQNFLSRSLYKTCIVLR